MQSKAGSTERALTNLCALVILWAIAWVVAGYAARCTVFLFCLGYGC